MVLGLRLLGDEADWLEVDADRVPDLREKRRLLAEQRAQVLVEAPGSRAGQADARDAVLAALEAHHPGRVVRRADAIELTELGETLPLPGDGPPLESAARAVPEDLCLMERDPAGVWRLTAAVVCFPTRWDLPSKLGRSLTGIHDPVPGYREQLAGPADRFFDGLRPGRIAARANWSLVDRADLFQPLHGNRERARHVTRENVGETVWLRAERQTLRRLAPSDAILFTIRIHRDRLDALAADPERAALLAADLRTLPEDLARYKSIPDLRDPVLAWLDERTAAAR
jgi:hypothetical protein